jgi:exodeoxyribonuclease V beta subunit
LNRELNHRFLKLNMTTPFNILTSPIAPGTTLVEAGAGTGKTYALTRMVLRLLLEGVTPAGGGQAQAGRAGRPAQPGHAGQAGPIELPHILVVTFTRAATAELVTRIRRLISDAERAFAGGETDDELISHLRAKDDGKGLGRLRDALRQCDELAVCTIHSFCQRVLTSSAFESGMPFHTENVEDDDARYIEQAAVDFWRDRVAADELLAALSVSERWSRADLVEQFKKWRRHPNTEILPRSRPVAEACADFRQALQAVANAFDIDALRAFSEQAAWNKDAPLDPEAISEVIEGLAALGRGDLFSGLAAALNCTTAAVHDKMSKRRKDQKTPPSLPLFQACDRLAEAVDDVFLAVSREFIDQVGRSFDLEKRKRHILAFDDMLRRLDDALNRPLDEQQARGLREAIGKQYEAALIDEFQDTDPFQYAIFRTAFAGKPLFLIGDPKQAIYRFRGADIFTYLEARREAGDPWSLTRNWRSESGLVHAVNRLFNRLGDPFVHPGIPFEDAVPQGRADEKPLTGNGGTPFQWWVAPPGEDGKPPSKETARGVIYDAVVRETVRLLDDERLTLGGRRVNPPDIAVLVRDNWQAADLQQRLRRAGVPAIIANTESILASHEMAELETVMTAVISSRRHAAVRAALTTELWGLAAADLRALDEDDRLWTAAVEALEELRETWLTRGFIAMAQRLIARREVRRRLSTLVDGERRLTNILHGVELLHQAAARERLAPAGLLNWVRRTRADGAKEREATELRLESEADAVTISTIHRAKGLQYGIVFCTDLWDSKPATTKHPLLVHHRDDVSRVVFAFGTAEREEYLPLAESERLAEDLRLAYVALTRAEHRCYAVWGDIGQKGGGSWKSALGYLLRPQGENNRGIGLEQFLDTGTGLQQGDGEAAIQTLAAAAPELMQLRKLEGDEETPPVWLKTAESAPPQLSATLLKRNLAPQFDVWRVTSFSALTKDHGHGAGLPGVIVTPDSEEGASLSESSDRDDVMARPGSEAGARSAESPDHEDPATDLAVAIEAGAQNAETPDHDDPAADPAPAVEDAEPQGIFAFARGARPGTCLHEIFEKCDFTRASDQETGELITRTLRNYDLLDPGRHFGKPAARNPGNHDLRDPSSPVVEPNPQQDVWEMLKKVTSSPLPDTGFSLDQVLVDQRLNEWRFDLPLSRMSPSGLGDLFAVHAKRDSATGASARTRALDDRIAAEYAPRLRDLDNRTVHGFLTGFVDLVFEHDGRWYLIDWKSNHLGNSPTAYHQEALWQAMVDHHYILQYHLYCAALHKFLAVRKKGYDYDQHFGGVFYAFLRGIDGSADHGWYHDRPPLALVEALASFCSVARKSG